MEITMKGISKAFGSNEVLKGVDLTLKSGEIHALMGENGASVQRGVDLPPRFHYRMPVAPHTHAALTQLQEKLEAEFGPRIWFQPNQTEVTPFCRRKRGKITATRGWRALVR